MKKTLFLLPAMALVFILDSCNHDKDKGTVTPAKYPNYSQFKAGSYWVYQRYTIDSSGNATPVNEFDSCYVVKDTVIGNKSYVKTYRPDDDWGGYNYSYTRDSLHYIVSAAGTILFSSQDFETVLKSAYIMALPGDTVSHAVTKITDKDLPVTVTAGTFNTINCQETFYMYPAYSFAGNPRHMNKRYAENTGIVKETMPFFVSSPNYTERRLIRFHINI
ncbi:MAG: hypothetical protein WCK34_06440 [Bacteroidota bacterium]